MAAAEREDQEGGLDSRHPEIYLRRPTRELVDDMGIKLVAADAKAKAEKAEADSKADGDSVAVVVPITTFSTRACLLFACRRRGR